MVGCVGSTKCRDQVSYRIVGNFRGRKLSQINKTEKFVKVFSLESFPLYGIYHTHQALSVYKLINDVMR